MDYQLFKKMILTVIRIGKGIVELTIGFFRDWEFQSCLSHGIGFTIDYKGGWKIYNNSKWLWFVEKYSR